MQSTEKTYKYPGDTLFVTFYSFKGGVGRSLALANAGALIAASNRRVLLIDADLEAPGLHRILGLKESKKQGAVEFITELKDYLIIPPGGQTTKTAKPPDPKDYIINIPQKGHIGGKGRLDLMPAGLFDKEYPDRVEQLRIRELYENEGPGLAIFLAFKALIRKMTPRYDYVLIDARTGYSDMGIVCTYDLADAFAFICGLNDQNVRGMKEMIDSLDENTRIASGKRERIFVASPVADSEEDLKNKRLENFKDTFGSDPEILLPYHPRLSLTEELFCFRYPDTTLTGRYRNIVKRMRGIAGDNFERWNQAFFEAYGKKNYPETLHCINKISELGKKEAAIDRLKWILSDWEKIKDIKLVEKFFKLLIALDNENPEAHNDFGIMLVKTGQTKELADFFQRAFEKFNHAIKLKPEEPDYHTNLGIALCELGKLTGNKKLLRDAIAAFNHAIKLNPEDSDYHTSLGIALYELGKLMGDKKLLRESIAADKLAIKLKPEVPLYHFNLGSTLLELGKLTGDKEPFKNSRAALMAAEKLENGAGAYNLACLSVLEGKRDEALRWLKKAILYDNDDLKDARKDPDFKSLRNDPEFQKIVGITPKKKTDKTARKKPATPKKKK